ncbi:MAG: FAD-binding oxidoreductase [Betaproteobacteria bacterium]|nr:MAG: FAD-binding oxidoreductase [Betaproteobacteria bacterium]
MIGYGNGADLVQTFSDRKAALVDALKAADKPIGLSKDTSNLFRDRESGGKRHLDVRDFNHVLEVNPDQGWVDVEGMTPYDELTEQTLKHNVMPAVVPQLKSITIGGAVAGVGIEASSFKYGLVHDTMLEIEVLTGNGEVVIARPDNAHSDLFFGFPNSYGTLGYALRVKARTAPIKPFVELSYSKFTDPFKCFAALRELCESDADFVDGVVFDRDRIVLTTGRFTDQAPWVSDYTYKDIFYRSLLERDVDYLSVADFIWRWDTDWFWCSKNLGAQNPIVRRLLGPARLNSRFYTKVMRWNSRMGLMRGFDRLSGKHRESVIQDVDVPIEHASEFLEFFIKEIGILPVWLCPIRACDPLARFDLYPVPENKVLVNFGFWDVVRRSHGFETGFHNRLIEKQVAALGGIKSLYSDSYFPEQEFWRTYNGDAWRRLKARYDPNGMLGDLYRKTVLRH